MIQPDPEQGREPTCRPCFRSAARADYPIRRIRRRTLPYHADGDCAVQDRRRTCRTTPYRQCRADFSPFFVDFSPRAGEDQVDRDGVLRTLRDFADTNHLQVDWNSIHNAPNEALVNALSMMSPCSPKEKQALLEARDLKGRADVLVAITEIELARGKKRIDTPALNRRGLRSRTSTGTAQARGRIDGDKQKELAGSKLRNRRGSIRGCSKSWCVRGPRRRSNMTHRIRNLFPARPSLPIRSATAFRSCS